MDVVFKITILASFLIAGCEAPHDNSPRALEISKGEVDGSPPPAENRRLDIDLVPPRPGPVNVMRIVGNIVLLCEPDETCGVAPNQAAATRTDWILDPVWTWRRSYLLGAKENPIVLQRGEELWMIGTRGHMLYLGDRYQKVYDCGGMAWLQVKSETVDGADVTDEFGFVMFDDEAREIRRYGAEIRRVGNCRGGAMEVTYADWSRGWILKTGETVPRPDERGAEGL